MASLKLSDDLKAAIRDTLYPVGCIYMSTTSTGPATLFGGTWAVFGAGRVPVGVASGQTEFDTVEKTGGSKTHVLTKAQLPNIQGTLPHQAYGEGKVSGVFSYGAGSIYGQEGSNSGNSNYTRYLLNVGNNEAHNNLQPYITCRMWKRTT